MKKNDVIKSLKHARKISPSPLIQDKILARVYAENTSWVENFRFGYARFAGSIFIVFVVAGVVSWQNPMSRANLSIVFAESMINMAVSPAQLRRNEAILDSTHSRLAELNLVGEPGLYTKDECEKVYDKFYEYMSKYEHKLESVEQNPNFDNIKSKIEMYEQEASNKWPSK